MILIPGAFNPITNAHIQIGLELQKRYPEEYIAYVPSSHNYIVKYKGYNEEDIIPDTYREMFLEQCLAPLGLGWSFIEIRGVVSGFAIDTLDHIKRAGTDVYYVIGMDQLQNLFNWHEGKRLIKENKFIVMDRKGYSNMGFSTFINMIANPDNFTFIHADIPMLSSTEVRQYVKEGRLSKIEDLVPECVYNYYKEKQCQK